QEDWRQELSSGFINQSLLLAFINNTSDFRASNVLLFQKGHIDWGHGSQAPKGCRNNFGIRGELGARCEEVAPEQVYVRAGNSRMLRPLQPSRTPQQPRRQASDSPATGPQAAATRQPLSAASIQALPTGYRLLGRIRVGWAECHRVGAEGGKVKRGHPGSLCKQQGFTKQQAFRKHGVAVATVTAGNEVRDPVSENSLLAFTLFYEGHFWLDCSVGEGRGGTVQPSPPSHSLRNSLTGFPEAGDILTRDLGEAVVPLLAPNSTETQHHLRALGNSRSERSRSAGSGGKPLWRTGAGQAMLRRRSVGRGKRRSRGSTTKVGSREAGTRERDEGEPKSLSTLKLRLLEMKFREQSPPIIPPFLNCNNPTRHRAQSRGAQVIVKVLVYVNGRTQVRRGSVDTSPQQTGTSRTVKRYPSSGGPITTNALPNGNGASYSHRRPTTSSEAVGNLNNAVGPTGANLTTNLDRIKIVFTPMVCRRVCTGGRCHNSCEKGETTTVYSENQSHSQPPRSQGFRLYVVKRRISHGWAGVRATETWTERLEAVDSTSIFVMAVPAWGMIPCMNGGRCIGRDHCWCPSNSTGKFCHLPAAPPNRKPPANRKEASQAGQNSSLHSMYTLPLSNQQASLHPSLVNVHIQHPPEAEVQVHQVARVKQGQVPPTEGNGGMDGTHSVQQRSQPSNGHGSDNGNAIFASNRNGHSNGHVRLHTRLNGYVGRCFQETIDGQCGKPLPGLTKQDDCCGSVGASWGLSKCTQCPPQPAWLTLDKQPAVCWSLGWWDSNSMCLTGVQLISASVARSLFLIAKEPRGNKSGPLPNTPGVAFWLSGTHRARCGWAEIALECRWPTDINECLMPGICKNAECLNTRGSYRCTCKAGYMLDPARSHCVSDKAISEARGMCYRSTSAGICSLPLSQHITKQICCCSRVGKAWGPACERCPLPDTDHFKEICPAGHGYTYSRSDIQITLRQVEEEEFRGTAPSRQPHPQPDYSSLDVHHPAQVPIWENEVDVVEKTSPYSPINLRPEMEGQDTAPINVATQVTDVDRCSVTPSICGPGVCVSLQAGYTCYCNPGYKLSPLQTRCVGECTSRGGTERLHGDFMAMCIICEICLKTVRLILKADRKILICELTPRTASKSPSVTHNRMLVHINECESGPCEGKGRCVNSIGSYACQCYTGYSQVITQNRKFCQDVNECDMPNKCPGSRCINTVGSYTCECDHGYALSSRGQCEDMDECKDPGVCPTGRCVNTPGCFQCQGCGPGFRAANGTCLDVNECQDEDVCTHGRCANTEGSYRCICNQGFQPSTDNRSCQDVDECLRQETCLHGMCVNLEGSYRCICNLGYQVSFDSKACQDIDECAAQNTCPNGICKNTVGSYSCSCRPGFTWSADGLGCQDVDECEQADACPNGLCSNSAGSFSCKPCSPGFTVSQDGQRCQDINECLGDVCSNGICLNSEGSYSCVPCPTGYRVSADGELCKGQCTLASRKACWLRTSGNIFLHIDECTMPNLCPTGNCVNTAGSYTCVSCKAGYRFSEGSLECEDVDECSLANVCPGRLCKNTVGSYICKSCGPGYELSEDGYGCEDVDECLSPEACPTGLCTNTEGSFVCISCDAGFMPSADRLTCEDVNECLSLGICGEGDCLNTKGSFFCICSTGYTTVSDGTGCRDLDECSEGNVCSHGQCLNTDGSFQCLCETGFKFSLDTGHCEGEFVLLQTPPPLSATPVNIPTSLLLLTVGIPAGASGVAAGSWLEVTLVDLSSQTEGCDPAPLPSALKRSRGLCVHARHHNCFVSIDMDECKEYGSSVCGTWRCENTLGSYRCFMGCQPGFYDQENGDCVGLPDKRGTVAQEKIPVPHGS
ncbi:latent-transforming growth factor beta-binding protein 2-like, partial [Scleropages formosus]